MKRVPKKTIQKEFNHLVASGRRCAKCKQSYELMHCSHVHSIGAYPNLRFDLMNTLPLCARCHKFWWHDEVGDAWEWFKTTYPGRNAYLEQAKKKYVKWTDEKLLEVRKNVKERNLKALLIAPELV